MDKKPKDDRGNMPNSNDADKTHRSRLRRFMWTEEDLVRIKFIKRKARTVTPDQEPTIEKDPYESKREELFVLLHYPPFSINRDKSEQFRLAIKTALTGEATALLAVENLWSVDLEEARRYEAMHGTPRRALDAALIENDMSKDDPNVDVNVAQMLSQWPADPWGPRWDDRKMLAQLGESVDWEWSQDQKDTFIAKWVELDTFLNYPPFSINRKKRQDYCESLVQAHAMIKLSGEIDDPFSEVEKKWADELYEAQWYRRWFESARKAQDAAIAKHKMDRYKDEDDIYPIY